MAADPRTQKQDDQTAGSSLRSTASPNLPLRVLSLVIGLAAHKSWPRLWQILVLIVIPFWFEAHFLLGVAAETRLFLGVQAMIFIPGVLFLIDSLLRDSRPASVQAAA